MTMNIVPPSVGGDSDTTIADRIIHTLTIYPIISPSMLQIGIGSSLPSSIWKPILRDLIERDIVKEDIFVSLSASGRNQSYTLISLKETPVNFKSSS